LTFECDQTKVTSTLQMYRTSASVDTIKLCPLQMSQALPQLINHKLVYSWFVSNCEWLLLPDVYNQVQTIHPGTVPSYAEQPFRRRLINCRFEPLGLTMPITHKTSNSTVER